MMKVLICLFLFAMSQAWGHPIRVMMTVPRTMSTAIERSIMERGDHKVFHEPWNTEYVHRMGYLDHTPDQEIVECGSYEGIKRMFYRYAEQKPVFVKDMIWGIQEEIAEDRDFLSDPRLIMTLLIRDPVLSIESFFHKIAEKVPFEKALELTREVMRYDALLKLAKKYHEYRGHWPLVIEAEELCARPIEIMQDFCERVGMPFMPEALTWEKGMPPEWKPHERWHLVAAESEGFVLSKGEAKRPFSSVPEKAVPILEAIYQEQKTFYEELKKIHEPKALE